MPPKKKASRSQQTEEHLLLDSVELELLLAGSGRHVFPKRDRSSETKYTEIIAFLETNETSDEKRQQLYLRAHTCLVRMTNLMQMMCNLDLINETQKNKTLKTFNTYNELRKTLEVKIIT